MKTKILHREELKLSSIQEKMIESGWGNGVISNSVTEKIFYESDGLKIAGFISYPKDQSKKYPSIIWCRGGIGNYGVIEDFYARGIFGQIASWGYVVFASQYRGNSTSSGIDEVGGAELNDVLNLIPLADEIECADANIWGIEGWSRGGLMTYLVLTKTNVFKAAITSGGISFLDCSKEKRDKYLQFLYELTSEKLSTLDYDEICKSRSVINFPEKISKDTNLLLIHGTEDDKVPFENSVKLAEKLKELNYNCELKLIEGGDHFLKEQRNEISKLRKDWYDKYLKQI
ncbi:MAG: prolyl oligopeptidase family serine peptidase [Stygiobacter sp.]|jgi:dipeptidyl aminopeptidase/acylaminoacyl peptidase|uniref:Prolyl oligopeptidase family serine peptidase n=1 Tax=Stygiobacter electus TaxID=3032292 RepID=A0AAE3P1S4_9BACT|nr:prolyl oligopeptidase family serine peptidase [Stygiobacter electus]MDF1612739.1 prolyl oligopeptidase family serine peptidase [Stygiobacter electus]